MSYQNYVVAAWAVFVVVLLWDWVLPRVRTAQLLRGVRALAARRAAAADAAAAKDLPR